MKPVVDYSYSGNLVRGVFYQIAIPLNVSFAFPLPIQPPGTVINGFGSESQRSECVYTEVIADLGYEHRCSLDESHITGSQKSNYRADLFGAWRASKFVCDVFGLTVVVNRAFRDELEGSTLKGFVIESLPVGVNQCAASDAPTCLSSMPMARIAVVFTTSRYRRLTNARFVVGHRLYARRAKT